MAARIAHGLGMAGLSTREYVLELDVDADPISGRLRDGSEAFAFSGWLGLASALERLLSASGDASETAGTQPAGES